MRFRSLPVGIVAISLLAGATTAQAGIETWVSGTGTDAGTCPITAPCKTFAYAHGQTTLNGAINVLSSGNFGPVTITKPISIVAQGVEAVINTAAGGAAIAINAGPTAIVSLRGLTIDLHGTANDGISFVSGAALHIQDSVIRGSANGIKFAPAAGNRELYVADSVVADATAFGIFVVPTGSAGAKVMLDRVRVENASGNGMEFQGSSTTGAITATVRDSVTAGGSSAGIRALDDNSGTTNVMVDRSAAVNNFTGIFSFGAGATIRIGDSTVTGNGTGLSAVNAILSYGTNKVDGNGSDGAPTSTIAMK
jgi:hypothetical protein